MTVSVDDLNFFPLDRETIIEPNKTLVCKFTPNGLIEYVNDYFLEFTNFEIHEIVGNVIENFQHTEIPKTIFNYINNNLSESRNVHVLLKDQIKDGRYYWYITDFDIRKDETGNNIGYISHRRSAPRHLINALDEFYQKLLKIEKYSGIPVAENYFYGFNEDNQMSFHDYTMRILTNNQYVPEESFQKTENNIEKHQNISHKKNKSLIDILFKK